MEVPRLGVELKLQLQAYTTAKATRDLRFVCDLHHSSCQCWILNPLSKARDRTLISQIHRIRYCWATWETPPNQLWWHHFTFQTWFRGDVIGAQFIRTFGNFSRKSLLIIQSSLTRSFFGGFRLFVDGILMAYWYWPDSVLLFCDIPLEYVPRHVCLL